MFEEITKGLTDDDILGIDHELTQRMRCHKPIDPLNPTPQLKPSGISDELMAIVDRMQRMIEEKYQTKIDEISDKDEDEVRLILSKIGDERFFSSPRHDPERAKRLIEELRNTVPYHKSVRYGKFEVINGELVRVN